MQRRLLDNRTNSGVLNLAGSVGRGFAQAGKGIADLGSSYSKKEREDKILFDAKNETIKNRNAKSSLNSLINPEFAKSFDTEALGRVDLPAPKVKEGFTISEGQSRYDGDGKQIISLAKSQVPKAPTQKVGEDGYYYNVDSQGKFTKTDVKAKDYWTKKGSSSGSTKGVPDGYVFAGDFDIGDDLDYDLAVANAYYTDKDGRRFVNKEKYDRHMKLGNTEIK